MHGIFEMIAEDDAGYKKKSRKCGTFKEFSEQMQLFFCFGFFL